MQRSPRDLIETLRFRSHSGRIIRRHRALRRIDFVVSSWLHPVLLPPIAVVSLWVVLDPVLSAWREFLRRGLAALGLPDGVAVEPVPIAGFLHADIPYPLLETGPPEPERWAVHFAVTLAAMLGAYLFLRRHLPLAYLVWALAIVHLTALAWFHYLPAEFSHDIASHVRSGLTMNVALVFIVPWILAVALYPFDISLLHKIAGTVLICGALLVFAPMQYLLHAWLLHHESLLVMPVLFMFCGLLADVVMFIALYAWAMSWED